MKHFTTLAILFLSLFFLPMAVMAAPVGSFTFVKGKVNVTTADQQTMTATQGGDVNVGDVITSSRRAKAEIKFVDGTILRIARDSEVAIDKYIFENNKLDATIKLEEGKIQNIVPKIAGRLFGKDRENRYEVVTPVATCGVRGTNFKNSHRNGISTSTFITGFGYGFNNNMPNIVKTINAGQTMKVTPNTVPSVRPAKPAELDEGDTTAKADTGKDGDEALAYTPPEGAAPLAVPGPIGGAGGGGGGFISESGENL